jgi:hypothetical protein
MASQFSIYAALLVFISSISAAPLEAIPSNFVPPPAGLSLKVLNADGNGCFPIAANVSFQHDGNSLSIDYSNFIAYTDFSLGFFDDRGCELVLQVTYPPNYSFYIHDPAFDGNVTLGTGGVAEFDTYSFFGPWLADTKKMVGSVIKSGIKMGYLYRLRTPTKFSYWAHTTEHTRHSLLVISLESGRPLVGQQVRISLS